MNEMKRMIQAYSTTARSVRPSGRTPRPSLEGSTYEQNKCLKRHSIHEPVCGRGVVRGISDDGLTHLWVPVRCGKWTCPECGSKRMKLVRYGIQRECVRLKMDKMMTLTLPAKYRGDGFLQLYGAWTLFCQRLRKKFPTAQFHYVAACELQPDRGAPHLHVITNLYLPQRWISACWRGCGGGRIVDIRKKDIHHMSEYITYVSKDFCKDYFPAGVRRFRTSRSVKLFRRVKLSGYKWEFFDYSLQHAWSRFAYDGHPVIMNSGFKIEFSTEKKVVDKGVPKEAYFQYLPFVGGIYEPKVV